MPTTQRRTSVLTALLVLLAAILVYSPGLSGDFLFDDFPNIVTNPLVHMEQLDSESLIRAARAYQPGAYGRPLATIWFGIDHLIGGRDPFTFKLSGLIVHLTNTLLVFLLVRALLSHPRIRWQHPVLAAGLITAIWAVHPLQVSSVLYIVQRMETLAATFTLLGILTYLKARSDPDGPRLHWGLIASSVGLAGLGLLSKETAILFPLFVLMLELTVLRFQGPGGQVSRALATGHVTVFATGCLLFTILVAPQYFNDAAYAGRDFTLMERLLSQPRALCLYIVQMIVPAPTLTTFYYDHFEPSRGLLTPWTTLASLIVLVLLAATAVLLKHRLPLYTFGIGWFFAAHALSSNVINLELIFEHRNYIALLGVLLAVAALLRPIGGRLLSPRLSIAIVALVLTSLAGLGTIRSATWGDPFNLAVDLASIARDSSRAANDLATLYYGMSDANPNSPFFHFAITEFERSRSLPVSTIIPEQGLILMTANAGREVDQAWWESLIRKVQTRPLNPEMGMTLNGLLVQRNNGVAIDDESLDRAINAFLARSNMRPSMHFNYGLFRLNAGHTEESVTNHFRDALNTNRVSRDDLIRMALAYAERGHESFAEALLAIAPPA